MSKSSLKKFKKNDYSYEDDENYSPRSYVDKRKVRRIDRALKTKDLTMLLDDEEAIDYFLEAERKDRF